MKNWLKKLTSAESSISFYGAICVFVLLFVVGVFNKTFLSIKNIESILIQTSAVAIMAIGQTYVLVAGGIDLSIPSIMTLSSVVGAMVMKNLGINPLLGLITMIIVALVCGLINGIAVARFKMMPFVVTLTMMMMADGAALLLTKSRSIKVPEAFWVFGAGKLFGIPIPIIVMVIISLTAFIVLEKTIIGRRIIATGANRKSADTCGIDTKKCIVTAYIISSLSAAFAAIILTGRLGAASLSTASDGTSLDIICAAIIGGASLSGGVGSILGALGGALIISLLQNVMNLYGANYFASYMVKAAMILIVTWLDTILTKLRRKS